MGEPPSIGVKGQPREQAISSCDTTPKAPRIRLKVFWILDKVAEVYRADRIPVTFFCTGNAIDVREGEFHRFHAAAGEKRSTACCTAPRPWGR